MLILYDRSTSFSFYITVYDLSKTEGLRTLFRRVHDSYQDLLNSMVKRSI